MTTAHLYCRTLVLAKAIEALRTSGPETCIDACLPSLQVFQTLAIIEVWCLLLLDVSSTRCKKDSMEKFFGVVHAELKTCVCSFFENA